MRQEWARELQEPGSIIAMWIQQPLLSMMEQEILEQLHSLPVAFFLPLLDGQHTACLPRLCVAFYGVVLNEGHPGTATTLTQEPSVIPWTCGALSVVSQGSFHFAQRLSVGAGEGPPKAAGIWICL